MVEQENKFVDLAYAVRDIVNAQEPGRLELKEVGERGDGLGRMGFLDTGAPTHLWSGIDGAYLIVHWSHDTTVDEVVHSILNGQAQGEADEQTT